MRYFTKETGRFDEKIVAVYYIEFMIPVLERLPDMITLNHCGCDSKHMPPFEMLRRDGSRDYTILPVKTGACFWLDGKLHETRPNMAILYDKEVPVRYGYLAVACNGAAQR